MPAATPFAAPEAATSQEALTRPFRLRRYFSAASLVGIVVVMVCLVYTYRALTLKHLIEHESRSNADLTLSFSNDLWERYRGFVVGSRGLTREQLLADPTLKLMRSDIKRRISGMSIVKIKVYNTDGLTVFSTDNLQIGEDKSSNEGFRRALAGEVASTITYRDTFDAFERVLINANLISSYIPIRPAPQMPPEGVFEVYSDVTQMLDQQRQAQWQVVAVVLGLLTALYLFLYVVVRKADAVIVGQALERSRREEQIRHQAHHDALTGLANRASFSERLTEALSHARRHSRSGALMFIDLDRFKLVNDNLGHDVGDELLKHVAERIHACLRSSDLLFRMGGDEFTVILPELAAPQDAAHLARRIIEAVSAPVPLGRHVVDVSASVGIAIFPGDGEQPEVLLKNADAAMYSAKQAGRSTHAFYRSAMNEHALRRLALEADLHKAMRQSEFELHYQPRWQAGSRRLVGAEALLRWNSPQRGLVLPGEFIDVLEESGLMLGVGEWVLRTACTQQRRWADEGVAVLRMSVNVSRRQFESPGFIAMVARVLQETSVQPGQIELELAESLLLADAAQAAATLHALKSLGVRIAIDGFGQSSLACLRELAVDGLRIDRGIVGQVVASQRERAVASAIIGLAEALGTEVVATGVENEAQARFFTDAHCHELQGFLLCRPVPPEQLPGMLAQAGATQAG